MPPVVIAAGITAASGLAGAAISSSSAKRAAQYQKDSTAQQIAESRRNQEYITGLYQPTINRGNAAGDLAGNFVGLSGGGAAKEALDTFRGSTGYNDLLKAGLDGVNASAYASGSAQSGAAFKALQDRAAMTANSSAQQWLGDVDNLARQGQGAIGNIAGVATNTTNNINQANQTAADASGNASLVGGNAWAKALQGLFSAGATAYGSSYKPPNVGVIGNPNGGWSPQVDPYMQRHGY